MSPEVTPVIAPDVCNQPDPEPCRVVALPSCAHHEDMQLGTAVLSIPMPAHTLADSTKTLPYFVSPGPVASVSGTCIAPQLTLG